MPSGRVLVIDDDEWVSRLLAAAIRGAGYEVTTCGTAKAGLETACTVEPDCIVCDVDLPDADGFWVARALRTQASRAAVTPILFLSGHDDQASRLEGFHVGADAYMSKPFRVDEVVAQVAALVQMATRLRARRESYRSIPPSKVNAIEGDLGQMSVATVLTILELERRSGTFRIHSDSADAELDLASGSIVDSAVGGARVSALGALRTVLGWKSGRFSFAPSDPRDPPPGQTTIGALLMEAVRLEDEGARVDAPTARSARPASAPREPSMPGDVAGPSIRFPRPPAVPVDTGPTVEPPPPPPPPWTSSQRPATIPPDSEIPISVELPATADDTIARRVVQPARAAGAAEAAPEAQAAPTAQATTHTAPVQELPPVAAGSTLRGRAPARPPPLPPRSGSPGAPPAAALPRPVPRPRPDPAKK